MSINEDVIRICENPLQSSGNVDVIWKRREILVDYRNRSKDSSVENKLKPYEEGGAKKTGQDKLKDRPVDYTFIDDEYCKVSAPKPVDEEDSRPRELKTNTAFGRSKMSFEKFSRIHTGGGTVDCSLSQPLAQPARCHPVNTRARNAEGSYEAAQIYCETDDAPLRCCGHNVEKTVDYCTCMCCVKGLFYHCTQDSEDVLENPCSCSPVNVGCLARWGILGVLSVFLPCLLCYPLARGGTEVCKSYERGESRRKGRQSRTVQNGERQRLT